VGAPAVSGPSLLVELGGFMDHKAEIHAYIAEILEQKDDKEALTDSSSLLITGRIDSMDVVDIFLFLEKKFGVRIDSARFKKTQVDSVDALAALVAANLPAKS
jgi:acyl carrier protein